MTTMTMATAIPSWAADALELRSQDGATKVSVKAGEVTLAVGGTSLVMSMIAVGMLLNISAYEG